MDRMRRPHLHTTNWSAHACDITVLIYILQIGLHMRDFQKEAVCTCADRLAHAHTNEVCHFRSQHGFFNVMP